jgi:hypothetical protein
MESVVIALMAAGIGGCAAKPNEAPPETKHEEHAHGHVGPHGGELIELGAEEYHAEVLHENDVVVYLLDGTAKKTAAIDAADVAVNVTHDGESEQFRLAASADSSDPAGKSSRFTSNDAELVADLKEGHADVQLVVTIEGTQVRGALEHDHEHGEGHVH